MKSIKIFPSNSKYTIALCGVLIISAGFFAWQSVRVDDPPEPRTRIARMLVEVDGKLLLHTTPWQVSNADSFDMTDALIDPKNFNHGIGKDQIPSIDLPKFADVDDPRFPDMDITMETPVIGFEFEGEARAYPVPIMNHHELVNDTFGDTHLTVAW